MVRSALEIFRILDLSQWINSDRRSGKRDDACRLDCQNQRFALSSLSWQVFLSSRTETQTSWTKMVLNSLKIMLISPSLQQNEI